MNRITSSELLSLNYDSIIKIVWHESPLHKKDEEHYGVIKNNKIKWDTYTVDDVESIAKCIGDEKCIVYLINNASADFANRNKYFDNLENSMRLSDKCVICGDEGMFHISDSNDEKKVFINKDTPLCIKCATKLAMKILDGIDRYT